MTKISIIIPTYNGEKNIQKQINTIIYDCQKYNIDNFYELVICDNCSTDNTKRVVSKFINKKKSIKIKIKYYKSKTNTGYPSNFLRSIKLSTSKYLLFLCDDNIPEKGFYVAIYNVFKDKDFDNLCVFPSDNIPKYKKKLFAFNKLSYVFMRGSILSGILLIKKKINYKYVIKNELYPQNGIFINYYLNYGLELFNIKKKIKCSTNEPLETKFNDRMRRREDLAVLDKINSIEIFYDHKKINYLEFFSCLYSVYSWVIDMKYDLIKINKISLAKLFWSKTLRHKKIFFIYTCVTFLFIKKIIFEPKKFLKIICN